MKLSAIAAAIGAQVENAPDDLEIAGVAGIEDAGPGQLTFVSNVKYAGMAQTTNAAAIIVSEEFPLEGRPIIRSKNPYLAFAQALELFYQPPKYEPGVHATAVVHPKAQVGANAHIGPYCVVDDGAV